MNHNYREATYRSHDDLELYYRDFPAKKMDGPPVVCLPGLTRNSRDFEALAGRLAARHRVITPDLRGRGRSQWDPNWKNYHPGTYIKDAIALLDAARLERVVLVGTSLGGIISMGLAAVVPQRLVGVVLNDIGPEVDPVGIERIRGYSGKLPPVRSWQEAASQARSIYGIALPDLTDDDWLAYCRRSYKEGPDGVPVLDMDPRIGDAIRAGPGAPPDLWAAFAALKPIPALAIRGATSDLLNVATFARMKAVKPDLVQLEVPARGHAPLLDEPVCVQGIDAFLAALPQRT
ncbi:MAG: alpha/beta fold hydrolase [Steroidobacteraceae bacterium]